MKNELFIKNLKIFGLFGLYDVDIPFFQNINIFVGENGVGKTTILNILNYVIQGDSDGLSTINFDYIVIHLGNDKIVRINHDELLSIKHNRNEKKFFYHYEEDYDYRLLERKIILEIFKEVGFNKSIIDENTKNRILDRLNHKYKYKILPYEIEKIYISFVNNRKLPDSLKKNWEYQIYDYMKQWDSVIYLPTYRRIEEDFNSYIENSSNNDYYSRNKKKNLSYLQFGMDDVQESIDKSCNELRNNTNEGFKGMTSNLLTNYINILEKTPDELKEISLESYDESKLEIVFSRLADKIDVHVKNQIIRRVQKDTIKKDKYDKYLLLIIKELINIYEKNKQFDNNLENFKEVCNKYLVNKKIEYDKLKIECNVKQNNDNKQISLKNLSSGEKQILSLFSKLYLTSEEKNIILFDEPELSLSIIWQRRLIPDILESKRCSFLVTITHSPFIFDNDLRNYAIDIQEYIKPIIK